MKEDHGGKKSKQTSSQKTGLAVNRQEESALIWSVKDEVLSMIEEADIDPSTCIMLNVLGDDEAGTRIPEYLTLEEFLDWATTAEFKYRKAPDDRWRSITPYFDLEVPLKDGGFLTIGADSEEYGWVYNRIRRIPVTERDTYLIGEGCQTPY